MRVLYIILTALVLSSATAHAAGTWTLMYYLAVDDADSADVEDAAIRDMNVLAEKGAPAGVTILAQFDRGSKLSQLMQNTYSDPNYSGAKRYHVQDGKWNCVEKLGEVNTGDPKALYSFMEWAMRRAPADRYMLVISSHGSGLMSWRGVGAVGSANPGEVQLNRYVAYDDTDKDCLTVFELQRVLEAARQLRDGQKPIEIVALDACMPAAVEALYQVRNDCSILVGSAATVPMAGFDHGPVLAALRANPAAAPETLAKTLVKAFIDNCSNGDNVMGAFQTAKAEELVGAIENLSQELIRATRQVGSISLKNLTSYGSNKLYWDLKRVAERLADESTDLKGASNAAALRQAARDVVAARRAALVPGDDSMWYMGDYSSSKVGGLSIYWPEKKDYQGHRSFYKAFEFSKKTHWDEFLDLRELGLTE